MNFKEAYQVYHLSRCLDCDVEASVAWFSFARSSEDVLDTLAWEMTYASWTVGDIRVNICVRAVPVKFEVEPRKTIEKSAYALSSVLSVLEEIPNLTDDMSIFKDELIEEDVA